MVELTDELKIILLVTLLGVTLVYSLFVAGTLLLWLSLVLPFLFLYLFWRFVRAVERIADTYEAQEQAP